MTAPLPPTELSALVSARLCHDLISPMGAIGNGLELLQMTQNDSSAELTLVSESLANALAKLRFYRIAFGPADLQARQSIEEATAITGGNFQGRFTVAWRATSHDMRRSTAKQVYLAILCIEKSLPMGGAVQITVGDDVVDLNVTGRRVAPPTELWAHVTDGAPLDALRSDGVQFALLREALIATGDGVELSLAEDSVALRLTVREPLPA